MSSENYLKVPSCLLAQQQQSSTPQSNLSNSSLNSNGPSSIPTINTSSHCGRGSGSNLRESSCNLIRVPWKIVVLGEAGVGKSSLVRQFLTGTFNTVYNPTVEDSYQHNISLPDGLSQCIEILDTSGFYQFPAMRELNIRSGAAFILVFDITKEESLNSLVNLYKEIIHIKGVEKIPMILVGNKLDMTSSGLNPLDSTAVDPVARKAMLLAQTTLKCPYIETSAKDNVNVGKIFTLAAEQVYRDVEAALEAINNSAADSSGSGGGGRRNSTISFVVRRISSTNLTVKPVERLSRRFSEPVACAEIVVPTAAAPSSVSNVATDCTTAGSTHSIPKNLKQQNSSSSREQSSTPGSTHKRKQKNCTIS